MLNPYKNILKILLNIFRNQRWHIQYRIKSRQYKQRIKIGQRKPIEFEALGNILIIVPHADDELIGNYQLLKYAGNRLYVYHIGNYKKENQLLINARNEELRKLCKQYGAHLFNHADSPYCQDIIKILSEYSINTIFTPDLFDWHIDHQDATKYLIESLDLYKWDGEIFTYSISVPKSYVCSSYFIPYSKNEQKEKWLLFKQFYPSQNFMPVKRFIYHERLNAIGIDRAYSADLYSRVTLSQLKKLQSSAPNERMRDIINSNLNNIVSIRELSDNKSYK